MGRFQPTVRTGIILAGLLLLLGFPPVASALREPFYIGVFSRIFIYALAAVSLASSKAVSASRAARFCRVDSVSASRAERSA